jgi:hypothetical protein
LFCFVLFCFVLFCFALDENNTMGWGGRRYELRSCGRCSLLLIKGLSTDSIKVRKAVKRRGKKGLRRYFNVLHTVPTFSISSSITILHVVLYFCFTQFDTCRDF